MHNFMRHYRLPVAIKVMLAVVLALNAASAHAQNWPDKPVTIVVNFPPGGSTDQVARALAPRLSDRLKQSFVIENKAGATGTIGAMQVKRSPPDGHTLLVTSLGPLVIVPHLMKNMPYDALNDFDLITVAVRAPNVLVVPAGSPHKTLADVVNHLKANPGKMSFGSAGNGSSDHLTAELFWLQTGTTGLHVPYKGGALAISDLLGSQLDAAFQNINAVFQHIKSGKLRTLAITSVQRSPLLPDVPTLGEVGISDVEVYSWQAMVAPKGLPVAVRDKINASVVAALNDPQVKDQFVSIGFELVGNTPAQFATYQQQEFARWKKVIETRKISVE